MKKRIYTLGLLVCAFSLLASPARAAVVSIDLDTVTGGVQSAIDAALGDMIDVALVIEADAAGISSYGVSVQYDPSRLDLDAGSVVQLLPPGFSFNFGPVGINEAVGELETFAAGTFGPGPVSTSFVAGTMSFEYIDLMPTTILPGFFNVGVDGMFDNAGGALDPDFVPGLVRPRQQPPVIPEPATLLLLAAGLASLRVGAWRGARRKKAF